MDYINAGGRPTEDRIELLREIRQAVYDVRLSTYLQKDWRDKHPGEPEPLSFELADYAPMVEIIGRKAEADCSRWLHGELSMHNEAWQALAVKRAWNTGVEIPVIAPWEHHDDTLRRQGKWDPPHEREQDRP